MQPPAAPTLHPKRCVLSCDSCGHAEKTNSQSYPFKCLITKPVPMMVHEYCVSWFGYVGCCSHSGTPDADARQRIEDVVKELERRLAQSKRLRTYFTSEECARTDGYESGLESAIALLKDGVGRKC